MVRRGRLNNTMQLITAKCPDCGADLNIPEGSLNVTCEYCGSNILVTDVLGSNSVMQNCMTLAYAALKNEDYKEAYGHFNSALETDMKSSGAWFGKALCAGELGSVAKPRFDEMMTMFETAINYAPADKQNNLKKNAAAEVVKAIQKTANQRELAEEMMHDLDDGDADDKAMTDDMKKNLEKTKEEILRALNKAHEYDPANNDVTKLIDEVSSGTHPESQKLEQMRQQLFGSEPLKPDPEPPAPAPVTTSKKSGCSMMIAALMFIICACIFYLLN